MDFLSITDRLGRITHYTYDGIREKIAVQDTLGRNTYFEYCYCGALQGLTDAVGNVTKWTYDIEGRMVAKTYPDGTKMSYNYENTTGRLKFSQDALGQIATYTYNIDNTLASVSYSNSVHPTPNVGYSYDSHYNRLTQMTDGIGTTTYSYVSVGTLGANRLLSKTGPLSNETVGYAYDSLGRVATRTVNGVSQTMSYDILNRASQVVNPLGTFNYAYLRNTGRLSSMARTSGMTTNYSY